MAIKISKDRIDLNNTEMRDSSVSQTIWDTSNDYVPAAAIDKAGVRGDSGTKLTVETLSSDPTSPANGRIWLRTDL